jgi:ribonuclease HII
LYEQEKHHIVIIMSVSMTSVSLPKPFRNTITLATRHEDTPEGVYEIALDECGRGPMFGRLYAAAVVLPLGQDRGNGSDSSFAHHLMRDSKKITSRARRAEIAQYIRSESVAYSIQYAEHDVVDKLNVLQANMQVMHACVRDVIEQMNNTSTNTKYTILVDGNYFKPFSVVSGEELVYVPYTTLEGGDNRYSAIAAASILAKDAHDTWIEQMCDQYPALEERYGMRSHVGYGTRRHLEGIATHGITQWHRRTFGLCKTAALNPV